MNLPNKLTISRVVMIPVFIALFYIQFTGHYFVSLAVFLLAEFTDLFDGLIARRYNLVTNLGKFLDPIADKVLNLSGFVVLLTVPEIFTANLGNWAIIVAGCGVTAILAREIIVSGFRMVAANAGIVIAADKVGKYKTVSQDASVTLLLFGIGLNEFFDHLICDIINYIGLGFFALCVILTVVSGVNYIVKNIEVLKQ
ncbi:MAG: CDP-diacylglycerol--glycerol-3-phosphate 3-phosphatidyltransferase [Clostridia bacterium]|nr:CDP-diacylglycerol--glycerol-3-phosphate 3-phosphatidyltransferase [Clostridia bacterium]